MTTLSLQWCLSVRNHLWYRIHPTVLLQCLAGQLSVYTDWLPLYIVWWVILFAQSDQQTWTTWNLAWSSVKGYIYHTQKILLCGGVTHWSLTNEVANSKWQLFFQWSVVYFIKEVSPSLAKLPLNFNVSLDQLGLTSTKRQWVDRHMMTSSYENTFCLIGH